MSHQLRPVTLQATGALSFWNTEQDSFRGGHTDFTVLPGSKGTCIQNLFVLHDFITDASQNSNWCLLDFSIASPSAHDLVIDCLSSLNS